MNIASVLSWKRLALIFLLFCTAYVLFHAATAGEVLRSALHRPKYAFGGKSDHIAGGSTSPTIAPGVVDSNVSPRPDPPRNLDGEYYDSMTTAQCKQHFPKLYEDIERRVAYWENRQHTISRADIDISWRRKSDGSGSAMRVLIHDNRVRITESIGIFKFPGTRDRGLSVLGLLQRAVNSAVAAGEQLPSTEVGIILEDFILFEEPQATDSFWSFAAHTEMEPYKRLWLMPNYNLLNEGSVGSYQDIRRQAVQYDAPFSDKIQKAVWRGTPYLNVAIRNTLMNVTSGKDWADVRSTVSTDPGSEGARMSAVEYCRYAMTIQTEGVSYSGRIYDLLNCDSLLFAHNWVWVTHFYHLLKDYGPDQNYVPVSRNWNDLEEKVQYYLAHPKEAEVIIANSVKTFRNKYLTQAATSCYIRALVRGYSSVAFTPEVYQPRARKETRHLRGVSFEALENETTNTATQAQNTSD